MYVNDVPSSYIDLDDPDNVTFEYLEIMRLVIASLPDGPLAVTHLGAAGCTLARSIAHRRPHSTQIAIDLDPKLLEFTREWFDLPRSPALRLRPGDAREALVAMRSDSADVIVRDAFAGNATPDHLTTAQFVAEVRRVLKPGGLYLANVADRPPLGLTRCEVATIRDQFGPDARIGVITEPGILRGRRYGNVVIAATEIGGDTAVLDDPSLIRRLRTLAVPMSVVQGDELDQFAHGAAIRNDPPGGESTSVTTT